MLKPLAGPSRQGAKEMVNDEAAVDGQEQVNLLTLSLCILKTQDIGAQGREVDTEVEPGGAGDDAQVCCNSKYSISQHKGL